MPRRKLLRNDLLYPELSYQIIGILFSVFNSLGYGYKEKYYQKAISLELRKLKIFFKEQLVVPLNYKDMTIGRHVLDFLINDQIILEIKRGDRFSQNDIYQTTGYLKTSGIKLAILARFSSKGLVFKRLVNV